MTVAHDLYPSRVAASSTVTPRQDKVVYKPWDASAPLTREQLDSYERNGFLILRNYLSPDEVRSLQLEAQRLKSAPEEIEKETLITEPTSNAVRSVFKIHEQSAVFSQLAADARLAGVAQFILGDDVYIHQSRLNYKPGLRGKDFFWHSDFETWHAEDGMPRMRALSMSILLNENTPMNGPTLYIPGSHKYFVSCVGETPEDHYKTSLKKQELGVPADEIMSEFAEKYGIEAATGPAGTVVIFDCNTLHGSNSNITPFPRSNAFFVFNAMSNKIVAPYCGRQPRPDFVAARRNPTPLEVIGDAFSNVA